MLRKLIAASAVLAFVAVLGVPKLHSEEKKYSEAQLRQQQKMKDCSAGWMKHKEDTGAEGKDAHNAYMSDCLKGRPISAAAKAKPKKTETAEKAGKKKEADEEKAAKKKADAEEKKAKKEAAAAEKKKKKEEAEAEKKQKAEEAKEKKKKKKEEDEEKKAKKKAA